MMQLHFPWKFDFSSFEPIGHGSYDLNNYNQNLVDNKITIDEITQLFDELYKSPLWIPTFPQEFRGNFGIMISSFILFLEMIFLLVAGLHKTITMVSFFVTIGALILAFIIGKVIGSFIYSSLEEKHLLQREKAFNNIIDQWNEKNKPRGIAFEVGKYGAYIAVEFKSCMQSMGKFLMKLKKVNTMIQKGVQAKKKEQESTKKEEDY